MAASASYLVLVVTAGLLFYVAVTDLRAYRISNDALVSLVALFFLHAGLSGRWVDVHWNIALAAVAFGLLLFAYAQALAGGGDIKLLTVATLWSGTHCVVLFLAILLVFALLHTLAAKLEWVSAQRVNGRIKIAFAPSVAAGLIGIFMAGCLAPI
jgi:Flp pilus assembly protein protease CpaA